MGAVHNLRIKSPYRLLNIEDIKIEYKPNEHGYLYLRCLIDDSVNFENVIEATTEDEIIIYEQQDEENIENTDINVIDESKSRILFYGNIKNISTTNTDGVYYLEIEGISCSSKLDIKKKSRSFQNVNMTYDELVAETVKDYHGCSFEICVGKGEKIGKALFQYKETDWNFLKRICSELKEQIYCDIIDLNNMFYFGRSEKKSYEIEDIASYKARKDLKSFYRSGGYEEGYHDTDYFYYEIDRREKYDPGDEIWFKNKRLYVSEYAACKYQDEIIYKYRLCRKNGVWQTKLYNSLICGASLEGKVLDVQGEQVKLELNIDEGQEESEASWFTYAPPTGNMMYSMPVAGTSAKLYFPDESGKEPVVTGCVRNNGSSCAKTCDTTKRYFGTEHGSEVEMTPGALNIKGGSASPISISFDDSIGVTITSPKKLTLDADSEIIMKTPKNVKINGVSQILASKGDTNSGFTLENDMHFLSDNVKKEGRSTEAFSPFDDEPQEGTKPEPPEPPKEEKKPFNWGKLACNVLAGLAVVAAVTVAAVAVAATAGLAGPVIGAIAIGGAVSGTAAVASMAVSDIARGEVSDMSAYAFAGAREAFVGALSGAIFGPLGAAETLGGKMAVGAVTNGFESIVRQKLNGQDIAWGTVALDGGIGGLTAGAFHYGGKAVDSASPYVKKAFNKVSSKLSENAKYARLALENVNSKANKSVVLGSNFGNVSKKVDDFVDEFKNVKNSSSSIDDLTNNAYKGAGNPTGRMNMAGKTHPVSGVEFDASGFPKFKSEYNMNLEPVDYLKSRGTHFDRASKSLYNEIQGNSELASKFTQNEIDIFKEGGVPKRFTWHHNEEPGLMQLVDRGIHRQTGHDGGFSIWGPGNK